MSKYLTQTEELCTNQSATPTSEINVQNLSGLYIVQMVSKSGAVISHKVVKQ